MLSRLGADLAVEIPPSWAQGRATFGGLVAGLAIEAMGRHLAGRSPVGDEAPRRARSLLINFVGPIAPGPVNLAVELLREGRSATQVATRIEQDGSPRCLASASFGAPRNSAIELEGSPPPSLTEPEGLIALPYIEGLTPAFTQHFELRWASGGPPGSKLDERGFAGWVRMREHRVGVPPAFIAALVDAWPAPVLQRLSQFAPASSVTWALDFVDVDAEAASDGWWAYEVDTDVAAGGWAHTRARLWSPGGKLVATSMQTVAVFG